MGLRPARTHRGTDKPAYTRVALRKPRKSYVKGVPGPKIRIYRMGNPNNKYDKELRVVVKEPVQIRHNAMEAVRLVINRHLNKKIGTIGYYFRVRMFPHQILREHKGVGGYAGADRISQGMKLAFGKPIGRAVRAKKGDILLSVWVKNEHIAHVKEAFRRAMTKLPGKYTVEILDAGEKYT